MYFLKLQTGKPRFIPICHPESDTAVPRLSPRRPLRQEGRQQLKQNFRIPGSIPVDFHVLPCYIMVNMNENPYRLCRLLLIVTVIFTSLGNLTAAISSPTWSEEAEFLETAFPERFHDEVSSVLHHAPEPEGTTISPIPISRDFPSEPLRFPMEFPINRLCVPIPLRR